MKGNVIKKLNKMGRIGVAVTRCFKILNILIIILAALLFLLVVDLPKDFLHARVEEQVEVEINTPVELSVDREKEITYMTGDGSEVILDQMEKTDTGYRFFGQGVRYDGDAGNLTMFSVIMGVYFILMQIMTVYESRLCKAFRDCQSPFEDKVIRQMEKLGYAMIPWALVTSFTDLLTFRCLRTGRVRFAVSFDMLLVLAVVYVLIFIFKYGAMLQQESDETI